MIVAGDGLLQQCGGSLFFFFKELLKLFFWYIHCKWLGIFHFKLKVHIWRIKQISILVNCNIKQKFSLLLLRLLNMYKLLNGIFLKDTIEWLICLYLAMWRDFLYSLVKFQKLSIFKTTIHRKKTLGYSVLCANTLYSKSVLNNSSIKYGY